MTIQLRHLLSTMVLMLISIMAPAQYNPDNPPEPASYYKLTTKALPAGAGSTSPAERILAADATIELNTYASSGNFKFVSWIDEDGQEISTTARFVFAMPARDASLTALYEYNPSVPGEPDAPDIPVYYNLTVSSSPANGGSVYVYNNKTKCQEGETFSLRADKAAGFKFLNWTEDGEVISDSNPLSNYPMPARDMRITANFAYDPDAPAEPQDPVLRHMLTIESNLPGACTFSRATSQLELTGADIQVTTYPQSYYNFICWTCEGDTLDYNRTTRFVMRDHDVTLVANYEYDYSPNNPGEPGAPTNKASFYGLHDYAALKERFNYPIYLDNTAQPSKGILIDVQFPEGFAVDKDNTIKTRVTEAHALTVTERGNNTFRFSTINDSIDLVDVNGIVFFIPVTIPEDAVIDTTYQVILSNGALVAEDNSDKIVLARNGGLKIMEEGYCQITGAVSKYGTIEGGGRYKIGDMVTLTAVPNPRYIFKEWTNGVTANPYTFEATGSMVIGAYYEPSDACPAPEIRFDGYMLSLSCPIDDAQIHYTLNGDDPTELSPKYREPIKLASDCAIKAIALHEDYKPSEIATAQFAAASVTCAAPTFRFTNSTSKLTITSATEGASILYGIDDEPVETLYDTPIKLERNCTVHAIAVKDKWFDSPQAQYAYNNFAVETPVITLDGYMLTISCETNGAVIRYTLDGSDPAAESPVYAEPVALSEDCAVKVIATKEGYRDSQIVSKTFVRANATCAEPTFAFYNGLLTISSATPYSTIKYSIDTDEVNLNYQSSLSIWRNCTVYAKTTKTNWFESEVVTYECLQYSVATPEIELDGYMMILTCATDSAEIRYSIDGSSLTAESPVYAEPVALSEDCTIIARASKAGYNDSQIAIRQFVKADATCAAPTFKFEDGLLAIFCSTPGANITYFIEQDSGNEYEQPIQIEHNCTVQAYAWKANWYHSKTSSIRIVGIDSCAAPTINYNGRYATIDAEEDCKISYSLNGSELEAYAGRFDTGGIAEITAVASRTDYKDNLTTYLTPSYYDGEKAIVEIPGGLDIAFGWTGTEKLQKLEALTVSGNINASDLFFMQNEMYGLLHLDLTECRIDSITRDFPHRLYSVRMPREIGYVEPGLFDYCFELGAVVWNSDTSPAEVIIEYPDLHKNTLFYVKSEAQAPIGARNVVVNGVAQQIVLTDTIPNNFLCLEPFVAASIKYTRHFDMTTALDGNTAGWQTIALPFDVQTVSHDGEEIKPFADNSDYDLHRPYWLNEPSGAGFASAANIQAYRPYLISMPNNPAYADRFNITGEVAFEADNVEVPVTEPIAVEVGEYLMVPTTVGVFVDNIAVINLEEHDGLQPGEAFVPGLRGAVPFEAYLTKGGKPMAKPVRVADFLRQQDALPTARPDLGLKAYANGSDIHVFADADCEITLYNALGMAVRSLRLTKGHNVEHGLQAGVYFLAGHKLIVR